MEKVEGLTLSWVPPGEEEVSGHYDENLAENLPTSRYYYDGQMMVEDDYTVEGQNEPIVTVMRYGIGARGIDFLAKSVDGEAETVVFPLYDGHGNMIATLGRSESSPYFGVADLRSYDVWGAVRSGSTTGDPMQRYCANLGHVQDDESGLIYMRARYYEPWSGRFISEDPAKHGANYATYCDNLPTHKVDSSGAIPEWVSAMVMAGWAGMTFVLMYFNSRISHAARTVAIAGSIFLAAWFTYRTTEIGPPDSNLALGTLMFVLTHTFLDEMAAELNRPSELPASVLAKAQALVRNYMLVMQLFLATAVYLGL